MASLMLPNQKLFDSHASLNAAIMKTLIAVHVLRLRMARMGRQVMMWPLLSKFGAVYPLRLYAPQASPA
jgi:hypothetical protein